MKPIGYTFIAKVDIIAGYGYIPEGSRCIIGELDPEDEFCYLIQSESMKYDRPDQKEDEPNGVWVKEDEMICYEYVVIKVIGSR